MSSLRQLIRRLRGSLLAPVLIETNARFDRLERNRLAAQMDTEALIRLQAVLRPRLAWTAYALRPGNLECVINEINLHGRTSLLELGTGISTLYIAALCPDCHVVSVDESAEWQTVVSAEAKRLGIDEGRISYRAVPLKPAPAICADWYDPELLGRSLGQKRFDAILVDAPKSDRQNRRGGAFHHLGPWLAEDFVWLLDDALRPEIAALCQEWSDRNKWRLEHDRSGRLAILRPDQTRAPYAISP